MKERAADQGDAVFPDRKRRRSTLSQAEAKIDLSEPEKTEAKAAELENYVSSFLDNRESNLERYEDNQARAKVRAARRAKRQEEKQRSR